MSKVNIAATKDKDAALEEKQQKKLNQICDRRANDTSTDLQGRYGTSAEILDLMNEAEYGAGAVQKLASRLNVHYRTLYKEADVPKVFGFTASELEQVAKTPARFGQPLSWSHLVVVAAFRPSKGEALTKQSALAFLEVAREKGLKVDGLREYMASTKAKASNEGAPTSKASSLPEQATRVTQTVTKALEPLVEKAASSNESPETDKERERLASCVVDLRYMADQLMKAALALEAVTKLRKLAS